MNIVWFGYDALLPCLLKVLEDGHRLNALFIQAVDNVSDYNTEILQLAEMLNVPVFPGKPQQAQIDALIAQGSEVFITAGYGHKVPVIDDNKAFGINIHPTLLPEGRGKFPIFKLFTDKPDAAGVTIHKLAQDWDTGDILAQDAISLGAGDDYKTFMARFLMRAPVMLTDVLKDLPTYWQNATPQSGSGSTWDTPDDGARTLHWHKSVAELDKIWRGFGWCKCLAEIDDVSFYVSSLKLWVEAHDHQPGKVVLRMKNAVVITVKDGYALIED